MEREGCGFNAAGSTIVHALLQATCLVNDPWVVSFPWKKSKKKKIS
jgi:3-methyladenine DNA glycosylase Tag